jgi:ATP-dependent Clp endopeptidase proteolytic subunit ClpP
MSHEIKLYGPIGGFFGFTADELIAQIPDNAKEVTLRIHSPGGSVGEGLAIYHALRDHPAQIRTIVDGYAASSASFVMLAGDVREVHRNSIVFVHKAHTGMEGNADELRKAADGLDVHDEAILDIYNQRTGMALEDLTEMMKETAFFRGVDAVENGFATAVIDNPEANAQIAAMLTFEGLAAGAKEGTSMKTRKVIEAENKDLTGQVEAIRQERDESIEAARAELNTVKGEMQAQIDELTASDVTKAESITALESKVEEVEALVVDATEEAEATKAELATVQGALEKAEAALANPALADASLKDADGKNIPAAQIDAEADAAEKAAQEAAEDDKPKNILEQFEAMEQGADRTAFWADNKREILKLYETRGNEEDV